MRRQAPAVQVAGPEGPEMAGCLHPVHCILPPYVLDRMARSDDPEIREIALQAIAASSAARAMRTTLAALPAMAAIPSPAARKHRLVYDLGGGAWPDLPGRLVRSEGHPAAGDVAADEAYAHSGATYDFYRRVLGRNSLDDRGMSLISSVHYGRLYANAFWTGEQMAYGDGDGRFFLRFTRALDVVGHELTHGVVAHTSNLEYRGESGALNEHFADVFGVLVAQWKRKQTVEQARWSVGEEVLGPALRARRLRTFKAEKAYEDDPVLGDDPQPKHLRDMYRGWDDDGGVHINSGIPNHAFYLVATALGGKAWETAGRVWYDAMRRLSPRSGFAEMAEATRSIAATAHGGGSRESRVVASAWKAVGL